MSTTIVKHSTADRVDHLACPQSYLYREFHNEKHWLWTSYLSYKCFAIVLTSRKATVMWHQPSMWENEADRPLRSDAFRTFLSTFLHSIKYWFRMSNEARTFKEHPGDFFVIKPTHGYGQEEALKWFTAELKDEFRIGPTVATYAPRAPSPTLGWATAEVCYDPDDFGYDSKAENGIKKNPRLYVNASEVRPVAQPYKPQAEPQPKPRPRPDPPKYPWPTPTSSSSQQSSVSSVYTSRKGLRAKKTAHQDPNTHRY
jgi:hypothetical protein